MQCFQENAFPFLDTQYMLMEFCRELLKAGKFSLASNYLKGTGTFALATEKDENLVIQAAREYFSASSLASTELVVSLAQKLVALAVCKMGGPPEQVQRVSQLLEWEEAVQWF
ncbi:Secretory pathway Sec39 [Macleaya cordata]|uniref:Secretory pathway Sec39 n=1 Tax=Macleaya cordata TaxID=56857 RepID=A0A200R179_MACCD|nr:Secretory pathway Sec39 [Macleaya cordata]